MNTGSGDPRFGFSREEIVERSGEMAFAIDGDDVLEGGLFLDPLEPLLDHQDGVALCGDEKDRRLDRARKIKNVHVLEKEGAIQINGGEGCLESCQSLVKF